MENKKIGKIILLDSSQFMKSCDEKKIKKEVKEERKEKTLSYSEHAFDGSDIELSIPPQLESRLFEHQKLGVKWLYYVFLAKSGGILGDDMGLGKTFQVTVLLASLINSRLINRVLIIAPVSVLPSWKRELNDHLEPNVSSNVLIELASAEMPKKKRQKLLEFVFSDDKYLSKSKQMPKIVISSYHLVANMCAEFSKDTWDYVILDEGHTIKNPNTKISKAMHAIKSNHRLILTGTPIQNNLNEFYALVDWVTSGRLLGSLSNFKATFSIPILQGQDPKASDQSRKTSEEAANQLLSLTKPILLQRKKCENPSLSLKLPEKTEIVIWIPLASEQRKLYEVFLDSRAFKSALNRSSYPVEVINHLKTLCRHPFLIEVAETNKKRNKLFSDPLNKKIDFFSSDIIDDLANTMGSMNLNNNNNNSKIGECMLEKISSDATVFEIGAREPDCNELHKGSVKLRVLSKLVYRLHRGGHRTLIFSQSKMMLDIIQKILADLGLASHRIDGSVCSKMRQSIIDEFNDLSERNTGPTICLLTTRACGFGITLTGADRVIIFDPSWNPAEDRQAVDRAFRIGQKKDVVVYRMIMASSVEEKMYEKQVFKDGLRIVTEGGGSSNRYFSSKETTELFKLGPKEQSIVMEKLWKATNTNEFYTFEDTKGDLPGVLGFSRHDNLYEEIRPKEAMSNSEKVNNKVNLVVKKDNSKLSIYELLPIVQKTIKHYFDVIDLTGNNSIENEQNDNDIIKNDTKKSNNEENDEWDVDIQTGTQSEIIKSTQEDDGFYNNVDEQEQLSDYANFEILSEEAVKSGGFYELSKQRESILDCDHTVFCDEVLEDDIEDIIPNKQNSQIDITLCDDTEDHNNNLVDTTLCSEFETMNFNNRDNDNVIFTTNLDDSYSVSNQTRCDNSDIENSALLNLFEIGELRRSTVILDKPRGNSISTTIDSTRKMNPISESNNNFFDFSKPQLFLSPINPNDITTINNLQTISKHINPDEKENINDLNLKPQFSNETTIDYNPIDDNKYIQTPMGTVRIIAMSAPQTAFSCFSDTESDNSIRNFEATNLANRFETNNESSDVTITSLESNNCNISKTDECFQDITYIGSPIQQEANNNENMINTDNIDDEIKTILPYDDSLEYINSLKINILSIEVIKNNPLFLQQSNEKILNSINICDRSILQKFTKKCCNMTEYDIEQYNKCISFTYSDDICMDANCYIKAFEYCDEDIIVHLKLAQMLKELKEVEVATK